MISNNYIVDDAALKNMIVAGLKAKYSAKESGDYLSEIRCLKCGKYQAYVSKDRPFRVVCNRNNNCKGSSGVKYTDYLPDVYDLFYQSISKSTPDDPFRAHKAYAKFKRGLKCYEENGGEFQNIKIGSTHYPALAFRLSDGKTFNMRLIDGPRKTHNSGSTINLMWIPKAISFKDPIYIAESPIKAMALMELGKQAISTLSSTCKPFNKTWILENRKNIGRLVLAFDNDKAGIKSTIAWREYCYSKNIPFEVMFPIQQGADWDDFLVSGIKNEVHFWKESKRLGKFLLAKSSQDAAESWHIDDEDKAPEVFLWNSSLWGTKYRKEKDIFVLEKCWKIMNGNVKASYSIVTEPLDKEGEGEQEISNYITATSNKGRNYKILADAESLCSKIKFRQLLMKSARIMFKGTDSQFDFIMESIIRLEDAPIMRKLTRIGYDYSSEAYVFKHIAFDKDGKVHFPNEKGYFEKLEISPAHYKHAIKTFGTCDASKFASYLYLAWGINGLIVLGYYVASLFSHIIYESSSFGFFPFLSLYGDKSTGKSTLTKINNAAFQFMVDEGLPLTKANTGKGLARRMAQRVNMTLPLLEGNKGQGFTFDENQLLPLYNRESPQNTAQKTMDLSTRDLPFDASLIFVQNREFFTLGAVKQRVISLKFEYPEGGFSEESIHAVNELQKLCDSSKGTSDISDIGVEVLKNRSFFEERIVQYTKVVADELKSMGIRDRRVSSNYAIPLAGLKLFIEKFAPAIFTDEQNFKDVVKEILPSAISKIETAEDESDLGQDFFNALDILTQETQCGTFIKEREHYIKEPGFIFVRLTEVCRIMTDQKYMFVNNPSFKNELRKHARFVDCKSKKSKLWQGKKSPYVWIFRT